ncbi:cyclin, putative [Talaromyces stipitatus ATCC 10500]|uniref:RNA polymerase II holoenzyme cyclin-like subunit n=1 Tax=Talaromyces stipitatus (strain ATCC 10500 / CBS 375.48 / QM 6759 / NRRL 1006) TaxID=441959 RepID=B8M6Q5_TALSN|nr:cyclin, putative [Talaromyces stipitatus ATCC 10500]EED19517.1 cyclin, putative [Talaromyces stipitatus ATCC 10500]
MDSTPQHRPRRPVPAPSNNVIVESQKQWYFTDEELTRTPSLLDGMSLETEHMQRSKGVNFIVQVGIMLKLPQLTLTTAAVFLHRFFVRHSMVDMPRKPGLHPYSVAAGCLFLASKVDENCRKIKEMVIACCRVAQKNNNLEVDEQNKEFWRWKDTLLAYEDMCLEALCFDLQLEQPHKICYEFLCYFGKNDHKGLRNAAWAFLNDSNYTVLCLQFYPRTIAAAALWAGARLCDVAFEDDEEGRPWWVQIDVDLSEVRRAVSRMVQLYEKNITVHRQAHEYPIIPTDGDQESTRIINPNPHSVTESLSAGESNGRKRSREPEGEDRPSPARNLQPPESNNHTREPSPKRQRLTPEPNRTAMRSESPRSLANGHHQPSRSNSRIPSGALDSTYRRQQHHPLPPLPPPPIGADGRERAGPVDAVQQRIDEIVQQGMARNDKSGPSASRNDSYNGRHRDRDRDRDRDRYRDHDRYVDRDHDRDRGRDRDWRRSASYESADYRDRDSRSRDYYRDSMNSNDRNWGHSHNKDILPPRERRRSSTTNESLPPRPPPPPSSSQRPSEERRREEPNEEGEISEEGEVVATTTTNRNSNNHDVENHRHHDKNMDNGDDDGGGGSEEGEL